MTALHTIKRQIADASTELGKRRDLHGVNSVSYHQKRAELADLRQERWQIKCEIAERLTGMARQAGAI